MDTDWFVGLGAIIIFVVLIAFWILMLIVSWCIGTYIANYFMFKGILWWVCSLMFMAMILGLSVRVSHTITD